MGMLYICIYTSVANLLGRDKMINSEKLGLSGILKIQRTYLRVKVRDLISLSSELLFTFQGMQKLLPMGFHGQ